MTRNLKLTITSIITLLIAACGSGNDEAKTSPSTSTEQPVAVESSQSEQQTTDASEEQATEPEATIDISHEVVYMQEIYANWPEQEIVESAPETEAETTADSQQPVAAKKPAQTHVINAQARIFKPDIVYINPGDTVSWVNMTSHNTVSVEGMIPEGAEPWQSKLGENLKLQLDVEGVYAYVCQPHIGFGMLGLIIVGQPSNLESLQQYAGESLKGPFRRLIGKLNKVSAP